MLYLTCQLGGFLVPVLRPIGEDPRSDHRAHLPVARVEGLDELVAWELPACATVLYPAFLDTGIGWAGPPEGLPLHGLAARALRLLLTLEVLTVVAD